jgi:hypothetical protein
MSRPKGSKNKSKNNTRTLMEVAQELVTLFNTSASTSRVDLQLFVPQFNATESSDSGTGAAFHAGAVINTVVVDGGTLTVFPTHTLSASEEVA